MKVFKKIMAVLAVLVIIALYVAVVLCAIFIRKVGSTVFLAAIVAAVLVPLMLYLVFWLCSLFRAKQPSEEDSWEVKTKKGFQEAAVFNQGIIQENNTKESDSLLSKEEDGEA